MNYILNYDQNKMVWKWVNECERQKLFSWNCCTSSAEFSYRLNPAEIYFKLWLEFRARALNFRHSALTWADEPLQLKFGSCVTCLCSCNLVARRWGGVCAVSAYFDLASYIEFHMFTSRFQPNTILRSVELVDRPSPCRCRRIYTGQWKDNTNAIVHHQTHRERQVPQLNLNFKPFPLRKHPFSRFGLSSVSSTSRYYSSTSNLR